VTTTVTIRDATTADIDVIAELITQSFRPLSATVYLAPDPDTRDAIMRPYFRLFAEHAVESATGTAQVVHSDARVVGAALWSAPNDPDPDRYQQRLAAIAGDALDRFHRFDALMHHPAPDGPHHYLAFLAVAPGMQGRGIGSTLLSHHHRAIDSDAEAKGAHLVASNADSARLYARHGYAHTAQVVLPNNGRMYAMVRPRRPHQPGAGFNQSLPG